MVEDFDTKYRDFFNETDYLKRWESLLKIYKEDYGSYRVLFMIEVLAFLEKWQEPSVEDLNKLLNHAINDGRFKIQIGRIVDLFQPVWPLEMAKYDLLLVKTLSENYLPKNYFFTYIKLFSTALVQIWWAFETLMNDFASIILEQRKKSLDSIKSLLLADKNVILNEKGKIEERITYQPIVARIQFTYTILTDESIDRSSSDWHNLMNLKNARDVYIHRIGKEKKQDFNILDKTVILDGFKSVQNIIGQVFEKTPEFSDKFVYKFLAFWSCKNELPFMWDGMDGDAFYLGLTQIEPEAIINLYASMPSLFCLFSEDDGHEEI